MQACRQPGRTSTTNTTAEDAAMNVPDQPDNSAEERTSAAMNVPDQPDNSAEGTSTSNVPDNQAALQDSDALYSLRHIYGEDYDADGKGGEEEEVMEETVLLTSTQQDDQNAS